MRKSGIVLALTAAGLLWAAPARAEFVCEIYVELPGANPTLGTAGAFEVTYYGAADCTGGFVRQVFYCSTGATNAACGTAANCNGTDNLIPAGLLYPLMSMTHEAMIHNQRVWPSPCNTTTLKAGTIEFFQN